MSGRRGDLNAGDMLGDFRVLKQIGKGGMGVVYLARDERLERRVALKVIAPDLAADPGFRDRFIAEARSAAAIDHENVVPVYSAGVADGDLYMAMRYVEGTDLRTLLAKEAPLEPPVAVAIAAEIASALDAAHAAGFVHRDVKPANILLAERLGKRNAFLTDFGLTKGLQSEGTQLTGTGQWIGTLDYVAPEQMTDGRVDARTDVYALGCVLYEALTGSVPYAGSDMQKMWGHVNEPFPTLPDSIKGGDKLAATIIRATAKDPNERFPSAGDLANAASAALSGDGIQSPEHSVATGSAATGLAETVTAQRPPATEGTPTTVDRREQPTRSMPPPRRRPGRGGLARTGAILGGAIVIATGLVAAAMVIAGDDSSNQTTTITTADDGSGTQRQQGDRPGSTDPSLPIRRTECASNVYVEERVPGTPYTSCPFAREVARAYSSRESDTVIAYSPVTGDRYRMTCEGVSTVRCSDSKDAVVYLTPGFSSTPTSPPEETAEVTSTSSTELGDWPGGSGYSAMLGAFSSESRARTRQREASERGLDAGVLYSSNFSSLRPGYWVVFSGSFTSSGEATERAEHAQALGYDDSYPRLVSP